MSAESVSSTSNPLIGHEVAVRVAAKQRDAISQQGDALVALIEGARQQLVAQQQQAASRGGIDVIA
ncbi:MAG: hypothetical protein AB7K52_10975 [Phycisphaerales bacterium]